MEVKGNIVSGVMLFGVVLIWGMFVVQISAEPASATTCYSKCMTKCTIPQRVKQCQGVCKLKFAINGN
ncbi:hypothetical protein C5167_031609 [Papaver somniferum]|uniref:Uncharacterized protein n=1 Tax=Papaver somniferum TaxID=3469 RepID=A0A4Y7K4S0_PAPSO|nr:hypothetical protein C5167_031609 [Papaver somniferum]